MDTIVTRRSGTPDEAVEVAMFSDGVALLDTKQGGSGALWFNPATFAQFVRDVKEGKYDPVPSVNG
jgi:hypothetical protein